MTPLQIGPLSVWPPVVLAPMAGVTNAPFRTLCRRHGAGLYVSEMVLAAALVHGNSRTKRMVAFADDERPRSTQLYTTNPHDAAVGVRRLVEDHGVDHVDLNFGCPARKVTRLGGGSALPARPRLLASIIRAAVEAAGPVPVTMKMRLGIRDDLLTFLEAGRIGVEEGIAAVALHARTAEQLYSGTARWSAIGELKAAIHAVPVLGNGDIWTAHDALDMVAATGCDGVVVGRGCLGRPWLFADLAAVFAGRPPAPSPRLGEVVDTLREHAALLAGWCGPERAAIEVRKHTSWYLTGYPVGPEIRRRLSQVASLAELDQLLDGLDRDIEIVAGGERLARGHTQGPQRVSLPDGWLDDSDASPAPEAALVGGGG